ncbi:MAG: type II secretion system protein GspC [Myxococcota bacterium]
MALDRFCKQHFTALVLVVVAGSAYFQAAGVMQLIGAALLDARTSVPTRKPSADSVQHQSHRAEQARVILARNAFDSVTGPLTESHENVAVSTRVRARVDDPLAAPACDGVTALVTTESSDRLWSLAALRASGEPTARLRRVGDTVGSRQVAFIGFNPRENSPAVWLEASAELCQVLLFRPQLQQARVAPTTADPKAARAAPEFAAHIRKTSEAEFDIDRSLLEKILQDPAELMKGMRLVPEKKDGASVGLRVFGVRSDSLLGALGLRNGDRLDSINGFALANPEKALEAYARLRFAPRLTLSVNRQGSPLNVDYRVK